MLRVKALNEAQGRAAQETMALGLRHIMRELMLKDANSFYRNMAGEPPALVTFMGLPQNPPTCVAKAKS